MFVYVNGINAITRRISPSEIVTNLNGSEQGKAGLLRYGLLIYG